MAKETQSTANTTQAVLNTVFDSANKNLAVAPEGGYDNVVIRAASGDLTAGESTTAITGLKRYNHAVIFLSITKITTTDGDDEVDFYIQTSYDGGTTWADMENLHYATGNNGETKSLLVVLSLPSTTPAAPRVRTDGTLADDTRLDIPFGDQIRIRTKVAGATAPTYAYHAEASFKT